jgi:hypothetical protein
MEQVLYNTIAGARPILADGSSFYYSDYYSAGGKKVYHADKWPCCSGTFPQLTADYGISAYYRSENGIYVNLFIPSRVSWSQNRTECKLIQQTGYPTSNATELQVELARPESFTVYLRVPAWANTKTRVSINGKRVQGDVIPGRFFALSRSWKSGDRVEFEIGMPLRLKEIDEQNANTVALMRGPITLFGIGEIPANLTRPQLLAATQVSQASYDWTVRSDSGPLTFRPFTAVGDETYRLYHDVKE